MTPSLNLDDVLFYIAAEIDLSDADRRTIERRYRRLKTHLERPSSPLSGYLERDDESRIYPQGSIAISATIISGEKDDRFDVDAIVEFDVPNDWPDSKPLDILSEALEGFPESKGITRNTRCVTVEFASMHMDVTPLDPRERQQEREGDIFHSPDNGLAGRIRANPYGFAEWFREDVSSPPGTDAFGEQIARRRAECTIDRLQLHEDASFADQDDLPEMIPSQLDVLQVVALKLLKRYLNLFYRLLPVRRPPSIYLTKAAADCGFEPAGLTAQLERLAAYIKQEMEEAIENGDGPNECNPACPEDVITDRWPKTQEDREKLRQAMDGLLRLLEFARTATYKDIMDRMKKAFGEKISASAAERYAGSVSDGTRLKHIGKIGTAFSPAAVTSPAVARQATNSPDHHFHPGSAAALATKTATRGRALSSKAQIDRMERKWPRFKHQLHRRDIHSWSGSVQPIQAPYEIGVTWKAGSRLLPLVCLINPELMPRPGGTFEQIPHLLFDDENPKRSGLCLFDPEQDEWSNECFIAETTIKWAIEWLYFYELWHADGTWRGKSIGPESIAEIRGSTFRPPEG